MARANRYSTGLEEGRPLLGLFCCLDGFSVSHIMAKAGFDPAQSVELWKNMAKAGGQQPAELLSTHPSHASRISDLQKHMPVALRLQEQARQLGKRPACR